MVQIQGIRIGVTVIALVFGLLTVNTLSAAAGVDVALSSSGLENPDRISNTAGEFQEPGVSGVGTEDPGFFGIATGVTNTVQQLITITTGLTQFLGQFSVPAVIGLSVQVLVDFTMGLGILQILSRFKF